ncbi:hypothetical protein QF000_000558 [Paraburkholderia atlantica]|uniref:Uncharacterized protein n=1 Tax=Paraburkholderia atlantica TaxID=2654982 RepID=A0A7W8Q092_PARAM|nr:hypothetical protein [Paraburkholderia atlantica]MBB5429692.1 hypothetical protein [Paraburkholderia atlantica]
MIGLLRQQYQAHFGSWSDDELTPWVVANQLRSPA